MGCNHEVVMEELYGYVQILHTPDGEKIRKIIPDPDSVRYKCVLCGDEVIPDKNGKFRTLAYEIEIIKDFKITRIKVKHLHEIIETVKEEMDVEIEEPYTMVSDLIRFGKYENKDVKIKIVDEFATL